MNLQNCQSYTNVIYKESTGFTHYSKQNQFRGIIAEAFEHLKGLNHLNICKYVNMLRLEGNTYLLFSEGYSLTLSQIFQTQCEEYIKSNFYTIVNQMLFGLQYLHSSGFYHGRFSLDCVSISDEGLAKISGYGTNYFNKIVNYMIKNSYKESKESYEDKEVYKNYIMNPFNNDEKNDFIDYVISSEYLTNLLPYMPPELIFFNGSEPKGHLFWFNVDIWSLGICILFIMSYVVSSSDLYNGSYPNGIDDKNDKIGNCHSEGNKGISKTEGYFEKLKNMFNSYESKSVFVESFFFVTYLLILINKFESQEPISALGLDIVKILNEKFKLFIKENEPLGDIGVVSEIFNKVNNKCGDLDIKEEVEEEIDQDKIGSQSESLVEESLMVSIEILTGREVLRNLISFNKKSTWGNSNCDSFLRDLNYLLTLVNDCLLITNSKRPQVIELITKNNILKMPQRITNDCLVKYSWFTYKEKTEDIESISDFSVPYSVELLKESQLNLSESGFFLSQVGLENVLYYWTLLGNDPGNTIPFEYKNKINVVYEENSSKETNSKQDCKTKVISNLEYFRRYKIGKVFLGELINHVKLANLFPMVIEHQLRPTCVYARQHCFIYQLLRIRRFKRLLNNPVENKRQIFAEAMIDIPPLLRKQIWCNLLDIVYRPSTKECPISSKYKFESMPPDIEQNLNFYNNDLLCSTNNLNQLLSSVEDLKRKIIHQQVPNSIYSFAIPLLLLYHNSKVYATVLNKMFSKYLKEFYSPTGSFVNNYLSEFSTILNFFDPEVSYHLRTIGAYSDSYALPWFMSLFSENTTVDQLYLIWDSILVHPKQYIKFLAVMIVHNIRERILGITDASVAISFISCVVDSLNVPMLMYLTTHMFNTWIEVINPKTLTNKYNMLNNQESLNQSEGTGFKSDSDTFTLDKNTLVFLSGEYPFERCFKLSIDTFSNIFNNCIIIDLRSIESYNLGHIPNSVHVNKVFSALSETDKKIGSISIPIFNTENNTDSDFNGVGGQTQVISSLIGLRNTSKSPWLHINTPESNKVVLAAGDGYDNDNEMLSLQRLIFEFRVQHVCYYRINTEEWPKVFTLSKI
ncbi:uncharacterized protein TA05855 [Theileria annulata]|uniref:Rab-GTPase-TBC domain containing protein n=1 Tax=Theileria annulata TaxID=5874 RepID=Q4UI13_THEAN|nr:uncharacterized protein TA05855 [Theileria annulata]CAI73276.1 hypothetical protein, conserved [Theileria annulata]|eukprot:XP_953953.1 hypothetical protein, conserved [Theileria annulata]